MQAALAYLETEVDALVAQYSAEPDTVHYTRWPEILTVPGIAMALGRVGWSAAKIAGDAAATVAMETAEAAVKAGTWTAKRAAEWLVNELRNLRLEPDHTGKPSLLTTRPYIKEPVQFGQNDDEAAIVARLDAAPLGAVVVTTRGERLTKVAPGSRSASPYVGGGNAGEWEDATGAKWSPWDIALMVARVDYVDPLSAGALIGGALALGAGSTAVSAVWEEVEKLRMVLRDAQNAGLVVRDVDDLLALPKARALVHADSPILRDAANHVLFSEASDIHYGWVSDFIGGAGDRVLGWLDDLGRKYGSGAEIVGVVGGLGAAMAALASLGVPAATAGAILQAGTIAGAIATLEKYRLDADHFSEASDLAALAGDLGLHELAAAINRGDYAAARRLAESAPVDVQARVMALKHGLLSRIVSGVGGLLGGAGGDDHASGVFADPADTLAYVEREVAALVAAI